MLLALVQDALPSKWTYQLTFQDVLAILGVLVGIAGLVVAYLQWRKAQNAEDAVEDFRKKLFQQKAAGYFAQLAPRTVLLVGQIRVADWRRCIELATELGAGLAKASGFCSALITEDEKDAVQIATQGLEYILAEIPVDPQGIVDAGVVREMTKRCILILYGVERISGRLHALEPEEQNE